MSKILVNTIGHTGDTTAMTVGSTGIVTQAKMPFFMIDMSSDQASIADDTQTVIQFNERAVDPDSLWDTSNYRFTVDANTAGYYQYSGHVYANSTQNQESASLFARKNGSIHTATFGCLRASGGSSTSKTEAVFSFTGIIDLTSANDYLDFTITVDCSSSGTTTINEIGSAFRTYVCAQRLL